MPFRLALLEEALLMSMALFCLGIGVRFLWSKKVAESERVSSWLKAVLLGMGCFFPGFIFSMPLTIALADHIWPGDGQSDLAAMEFSLYAGIVTAVVATMLLLMRRLSILNLARRGPTHFE